MGMGAAIKCDRCGKFEEGIGVAIRGTSALEKEKHLCTLCHESFKEWWLQVKPEPQGGPSC